MFLSSWTASLSSCVRATGALVLAASVQSAYADFTPFIIRGAATVSPLPGGVTEIVTDVGGEKAALGSNDVNTKTLGSIGSLKIDRLDDVTRFAGGSGPAVAPYLNFWITDGAGHYAVVANEPSDGVFQALFSNGYDLDFADLSDKVAKIYEVSDKSWLPNSGVGLTFADLAGFVIQAPTIAELTAGWAGLGTGAPRELGTNVAYGVNWVFGDTLSNYVVDGIGYRVANASVSAVNAVPEPGSLALVGLALVGGLALRRRRID